MRCRLILIQIQISAHTIRKLLVYQEKLISSGIMFFSLSLHHMYKHIDKGLHCFLIASATKLRILFYVKVFLHTLPHLRFKPVRYMSGRTDLFAQRQLLRQTVDRWLCVGSVRIDRSSWTTSKKGMPCLLLPRDPLLIILVFPQFCCITV